MFICSENKKIKTLKIKKSCGRGGCKTSLQLVESNMTANQGQKVSSRGFLENRELDNGGPQLKSCCWTPYWQSAN